MGGRGSGYDALGGGNEEKRKLGSGDRASDENIIYHQNDSPTEKQNPSFDLINKKYNIAVYRSTDKINVNFLIKQVDAIADVLQNLDESYNISFRHVTGGTKRNRTTIRAAQAGLSTLAFTKQGKPLQIYYNKKFYNGDDAEARIIKETKKSVESGWHAKVPESKYSVYVTVHELGHAVQHALYNRHVGKNPKSIDFVTYANNMRAEILKIAKTKYKTNYNTVSEYAAYNSAEWFAETFTAVQLGGATTPLTKAFNDYVKGVN